MASVKKRASSPNWICCYRLPDGERRQVSSGTPDRAKAIAMAWSLEGLGQDFSRKKALELVNEIAAMLGHNLVDPTPTAEWFKQYRSANERGWAPASARDYKSIEKAVCAEFGHIALGHLDKAHVSAYRDLLQRRGRARRTVRKHIRYIRQVLKAALEENRIIENPASEVSIPTPKPSQKQPFTLAQFRALLNATDGEWHLLVLVAGLTGQRLQDCLNLTYDCITETYIEFQRGKNQDRHVVPLHASIRESISKGFGPLFPELSTLPKTGSRSVSAQFRESILPRIGIVQEYAKDNGGNKRVTAYSFHSLRHMLSTELNRIGASQETRMAIVGHDKKVSAGYTHADFEMAAKALGRVVV